PIRGVLRGFLRGGVPCAARRLLGHGSARRPTHLSQLGPAAAATDLRRHSVRIRCLGPPPLFARTSSRQRTGACSENRRSYRPSGFTTSAARCCTRRSLNSPITTFHG